MIINKIILSVLFFCVLSVSSYAEQGNNEAKVYFFKDGYQALCNEVLERNKNRSLKEIMLGSAVDNYKKSFFADIDNDGKDEEFQFVSTRAYMQMIEIIDGELRGLPTDDARTEFYNGSYIIKIENQLYLLHMTTTAPLEIQELHELPVAEKLKRETERETGHRLYDVETICRYYEQ